VHNLVGTGDSEGTMNAANILKPALSRGEIQVIGATTFTEYRKYIEKDAALGFGSGYDNIYFGYYRRTQRRHVGP